jgi:hypothetical protein
MKKLCAVAILLCSFPTVAQSPEVICPVHNIAALFTGRVKTDDQAPTVYEYCHGDGDARHCFWAHN